MNLNNSTFVAFDTETTSLSPASGRIIELSGIKFDLKQGEIESFDELINPCKSIPEEITQINGITDEMVEDKPKAEKIIPEFLEFIHGSGIILLAHNAEFDISFMQMEIARLKLSNVSIKYLDTLMLARRTYPKLGRYNLPSLVVALGIEQNRFHRALADSFSVKELFLKIIVRKKAKTTSDLGDLLMRYI